MNKPSFGYSLGYNATKGVLVSTNAAVDTVATATRNIVEFGKALKNGYSRARADRRTPTDRFALR
jgi:hypothetical protein